MVPNLESKNLVVRKKIWIVSIIYLFFVVTVASAYYTFSVSNHLFGTSRVVNYAGLVIGATQRLVKLEITNNDLYRRYITRASN